MLENLQDKQEILDPTSGYGLLTAFCSKMGISSYCVEFNMPQFYWQLLNNPTYVELTKSCTRMVLDFHGRWPRTTLRASFSENWYSIEGLDILKRIHALLIEAANQTFKHEDVAQDIALALLLPFCGRLSCQLPGDNSTHAKLGGLCVLNGWENDFYLYLNAILQRLEEVSVQAKPANHVMVLGDARTIELEQSRFAAMLTSPPYPNHRDFSSMFQPEHALLEQLGIEGSINSRQNALHIIGSNFVSGREKRYPKSKSAIRFLEDVQQVKRVKQAIYDDEKYYLPYFQHYFCDLEVAYANVAKALRPVFEGYVIVVNNTHRGLVVPVSDVITEIWLDLGFYAETYSSQEAFHIGTKNPRARGVRARHTEYAIKIWRS